MHREEKREREFSVSGADGREVDGGEHPGHDPFKILRFLVLIFFAA